VHQGQRRAVPGIGQVGEERLELDRGQHALVHDGAGREAGEVHPALVFGPLAQAERHSLELHAGLAVRARDEQLDQLRQHRPRADPAGADVVRDLTPAQHPQALGRSEPFEGGGYHGSFGRNKSQAGRIAAWSGQRETTYGAKERVR